jgi:hypothetical protein
MTTYAAVGTCPICSQGRLVIARENSSGVLYVLCEECESEWISPEVSKSIEHANRNVHGLSTILKREDLNEHPWREFLW